MSTGIQNKPIEYSIEGMDCADCARTIEKAVAALPGVGSATVNFGAAIAARPQPPPLSPWSSFLAFAWRVAMNLLART